MLHIWHEDSYISECNERNSSTQKFFEFLQDTNVSSKLNRAEVLGFNSCFNLLKHMRSCKYNKFDMYIVFVDYAFDNPVVLEVYKAICKLGESRSNIYITKFVCFEYMLLSFRYFENWVRTMALKSQPFKAEFLQRVDLLFELRERFIFCINHHKSFRSDSIINKYFLSMYTTEQYSKMSSEKIAYYILRKIQAISVFKYDKTELGSCWVCDCCKNQDLGSKMCRLYKTCKGNLKTKYNKANILYNNIGIRSIIQKYG